MRYIVMDAEEARGQGIDGVHEKPNSAWEYDHRVLVDTQRKVVVYSDWDVADAPEDMYLNRDLRVFVDELNRLASERGA